MAEVKVMLGEGKSEAEYLFRRIADGKGWWGVWKLDTPTHHVVDTRGGKCDCPGFVYSKPGKKGCRHLTKALELEREFMTTQNGTQTTEVAKPVDQSYAIAQIITKGNLAMLTEEQRATYYLEVCRACDLNPATRPFEYINLKGKLVLYALKACTEQLRKRDGVTIEIVKQEIIEGSTFVVTVKATLPSGRADSDLAAVVLGKTDGEDRPNLIMKTITKAKRRVTLSICGLGMLDETEVADNVASPVVSQSVQPFPTTVQVQATVDPNSMGSQLEDWQKERAEVEGLIRKMVDELGLAQNFGTQLEKAYGVKRLANLTAEQIGDLQRRLIAKKNATKAGAA